MLVDLLCIVRVYLYSRVCIYMDLAYDSYYMHSTLCFVLVRLVLVVLTLWHSDIRMHTLEVAMHSTHARIVVLSYGSSMHSMHTYIHTCCRTD